MNGSGFTKRCVLVFLGFCLVAPDIMGVNDNHPDAHFLYDWVERIEGNLDVWQLNEYDYSLIQIIDIETDTESIRDWIVDVEDHYVYFIRVDADRTGLLGNNSLIKYDWDTGDEEIVYTKQNMSRVSGHIDQDKLIVSYISEDYERITASTLVNSCLLDLETRQCEFEVVSRDGPGNWIWADTFHAIRFGRSTDGAPAEVLNIGTGEIVSIVRPDTVFSYGQVLSDSTDIILIGEYRKHWRIGDPIMYHVFHVDPQSFNLTFLYSVELPKAMFRPDFSRDGKYLLFLQVKTIEAHNQTDILQVINANTGEPVANFPVIFAGPSEENLVLDTFQWSTNNTDILGIARGIDSDAYYLVHLAVSTGEVTILIPLDSSMAFAGSRRTR